MKIKMEFLGDFEESFHEILRFLVFFTFRLLSEFQQSITNEDHNGIYVCGRSRPFCFLLLSEISEEKRRKERGKERGKKRGKERRKERNEGKAGNREKGKGSDSIPFEVSA